MILLDIGFFFFITYIFPHPVTWAFESQVKIYTILYVCLKLFCLIHVCIIYSMVFLHAKYGGLA